MSRSKSGNAYYHFTWKFQSPVSCLNSKRLKYTKLWIFFCCFMWVWEKKNMD